MDKIHKLKKPADVPVLRGIARPALVSAVFFMAVTGLAYPLLTTGVAQLFFHDKAQGSLIERNGTAVGSAVIGQYFTRSEYFHGRPSVTSAPDPADASKTIDLPYNGGASGASNLGVLSKKLIDAVNERAKAYREENGLPANAQVPVDAVTASGSGLDPDISLANASLQVRRVAEARGLTADQVRAVLDRHIAGRQYGLLGDPMVNVLELNLALDQAAGRRAAAQ